MKTNTMIAASLVLVAASVAPASAMDTELYTKLANETVKEAQGGFIANITKLIKVQEQLVQLGVAGSKEYIKHNPKHAELLGLVIENVPNMMKMSLEQIEEQWHQGAYLKEKGYDLEKMDHFSEVFSLMDAMIHPATSYIALREYKRTRNGEMLERAAAELLEVVEHVAHITPTSSGVASSN